MATRQKDQRASKTQRPGPGRAASRTHKPASQLPERSAGLSERGSAGPALGDVQPGQCPRNCLQSCRTPARRGRGHLPQTELSRAKDTACLSGLGMLLFPTWPWGPCSPGRTDAVLVDATEKRSTVSKVHKKGMPNACTDLVTRSSGRHVTSSRASWLTHVGGRGLWTWVDHRDPQAPQFRNRQPRACNVHEFPGEADAVGLGTAHTAADL